MEEAEKAFEEVKNIKETEHKEEEYYAQKSRYIQNFKKIALMLMKAASEKFTRTLVQEQEILTNISDIVMQLYAAESVMLRVKKMESLKGEDEIKVYRDMLDVFVFDSAAIINKSAKDATYSFAFGEERDLLAKAIKHFTCVAPVNVKESRHRIADQLIDENRYCF